MSQIEVEQIEINGKIYYIDIQTRNVWTEDGALKDDADPVAVYRGKLTRNADGTYSGEFALLSFHNFSDELDAEGVPPISPPGISPGNTRNLEKPSPPGFGMEPAARDAARAEAARREAAALVAAARAAEAAEATARAQAEAAAAEAAKENPDCL